MTQVTYVALDGSRQTVEATLGDSVMATAVKNGVAGIIGECGGNASCATCHVYVQEEFLPIVGPPNDFEEDLLDLGVSERRAASRLSCQIPVTEATEGLTVHVPAQQS